VKSRIQIAANTMTKYYPLRTVSRKFGLKKDYLIKLINKGLLEARIQKRSWEIPSYTFPRLSLLSSDEAYRSLIFKEPRHFLYEHHPELSDYLWFHDAIDRFVWLLRLRYADRETMKSKRYRVDVLFQSFIHENQLSVTKLESNAIGKKNSRDKFSYYLLQGWYNELATDYPFIGDVMRLGTRFDYFDENWKVDLFPSWHIVKAYYTLYSYYNAYVFTNLSSIDTTEHRKITRHLNETLLQKFSTYLLCYPFSLSEPLVAGDLDGIRGVRKREWNYQYSKYPRDTAKSFYDIELDFMEDLKKLRLKLNSRARVSIIDLLYYFRIWANYLDIETIVQLRKGGLLMFLERNLFTILFFAGGLCEILALGFVGERKYFELFEEFYVDFIMERDKLYDEWFNIPQITRLRIYKHLGLIQKLPTYMKRPKKDPIQFLKV